MQWVFDEIFFCGLISHLPGPRVCRFKNTGTNAVRTTLRLVLLMKNDSHFRFLTSLLPPYRPLFETPTHLTHVLRARSSVSAHMYLQLTWRGRGQTEVPQEEL